MQRRHESFLRSFLRGPIQIQGFFVKELVSVLRQPRLMAGLVLGPFAILLLFGLGYRGQQPEFVTTLVVPNDPAFSDDPAAYARAFAGVFKLREVTRDENHARQELRAGQVDVVVIVPNKVVDEINSGRPASLPVLFSETDPTQSSWVRYFAYVQTSELNRGILAEVVRQSKGPATQALEFVQQSRSELDAIDADLRAGNTLSASGRSARLLASTQAVRQGAAKALDALSGSGTELLAGSVGQADRSLAAVEQELLGLQADLALGPAGAQSARQRLQNIRDDTGSFETLAHRIEQIPPETIVAPLTADAQNVLPVEPTAIAFYTPAVLALLLQHIGLTLSALSSVRDRLLGTLEMFRVSPIGSGRILMGKSLGYAVLLVVIAVALSALSTLFLRVPSLGDPGLYTLTISLTIFASLGLGFAISIFAANDTQAVQLSLLALLASVFFSGFFLPLNQLTPWVQAVSYLLPVTYGAHDLREVMLRGAQPTLPFLLGPLGLGCFFYLVATIGLQRQMRRA